MDRKKIIIASDSWKGSLDSFEVADAMARGFGDACNDFDITKLYISDGGEGFTRCINATIGGNLMELSVTGALGETACPMVCAIDGETAVMDVASIVGINLIAPEDRDPWNASSRGVGMAINQLCSLGFKHIIIGLGGSVTNDCGLGMIEEITCDLSHIRFTIASDVTSPLLGPNGATYMFARQKGATEEMLELLEQRNRQRGEWLEKMCGRKIMDLPGAGSAGGIGCALLALPNTRMVSGIELLLSLYDFDSLLSQAALVVTGEGRLDFQSLMGKAPYGIAMRAQAKGIHCIALCGQVDERGKDEFDRIFTKTIQASPSHLSIDEMMKPEIAKQNIYLAIKALTSSAKYFSNSL